MRWKLCVKTSFDIFFISVIDVLYEYLWPIVCLVINIDVEKIFPFFVSHAIYLYQIKKIFVLKMY